MRFKIVTEKQIRTPFLENARFLLRYKATRLFIPQSHERDWLRELKENIDELGETTPKLLLERISYDLEEQLWIVPWLWHLIAQGSVNCELSDKLTMNTPIWSTKIWRIPAWRHRENDWAL